MTYKRVLIAGIPHSPSRSVLFQSAVFWAEEGCKVLYIAKSKFENVPSTVHGPQIPSSEILTKIRIVYIDHIQELLKCIIDILTFRDVVPRVILVEGLEAMVSEADQRDADHQLARACATLCHVATTCAAHCDLSVHLLVTVATAANKLPPVIATMFDSFWCFDSENNTVTRVLPLNASPVEVLTLASRPDGAFVLREIRQLFITIVPQT